jgi:predicted ribosomally synthesized peptide with nif11-like leader
MASRSLQDFNTKIAASPELQKQVEAVQSPVELIALAQAQGLEFTPDDFRDMVQTAFQHWLTLLDGTTRNFFAQAQAQPELNQAVKSCQSPDAVLALAKEQGIEFTIADLQQAAIAARTIPGFSFEKLWFKNLGL